MEYFFIANQFGSKFAGPFKTHAEAVTATASAPVEMRPVKVEKMYFCPDKDGKPCEECSRMSAKEIQNTIISVENKKRIAPMELHQ